MFVTVKPWRAFLLKRVGTKNSGFTVSARLFIWGVGLLVLNGAPPVTAKPDESQICDQAAHIAASETGVPLDVLSSITRTETGRGRGGTVEPWPWTVNMEGTGKWFETEDAARAYVFKHFKRGARSFDVGCFQINYKWHGAAFRSIDEMFDPLENARYAAAFLKRLHVESGNWSEAAGAYHSRTPKFAKRYRARFDEIRSAVNDQPMPPRQPDVLMAANHPTNPIMRENRFPLLQSENHTASRGSLVPLGAGQGQALILFNAATGGS